MAEPAKTNFPAAIRKFEGLNPVDGEDYASFLKRLTQEEKQDCAPLAAD